MAAKIFKNPVEVVTRLDKLGLKREQLFEVIEAMVAARAESTPNDPPGAAGWSAWRMGTRRSREVFLVEPGWERDDSDQIAAVVNNKLGIRIVVANTDDATGVEGDDLIPQNWSKKGAATDRLINENQLSFAKVLEESVKVIRLKPKASGRTVTWYLCVYCEGDTFRAELSCPAELDNGYFTDFVERIIIIGPDDGDGGVARRRDDESGGGDSEFPIPVKRKK